MCGSSLRRVTDLSLRTRLTLIASCSLLTGVAVLAIGVHHLERLQIQGASLSAAELRRILWLTGLAIVVIANLAGFTVVWLMTRRVVPSVQAARDAVFSLGRITERSGQRSGLPSIALHPELAELHRAVDTVQCQLEDAIGHARQESDQNRAIIDAISASVFAVDGGGRILRANPASAQLFDRPHDTLPGVVLSDMLALESLHMTVDEFGTLTFAGAPHARRFNTRIRVFGRRALPAEVSIMPLALTAQQAWVIFVYDLSEKYQDEEKLLAAQRSAETANSAKTAFLARMSHELRTPLNSMIGFTKIVRRSRSSQLSERDRNYLDRVQASSEQLLTLVTDILDLTNIESGAIELHPSVTDVSATVRAISEQYERLVADRPVLFVTDAPEHAALATVDSARLGQIVTSLIGNAVKFTARGTIRVTVCVHEKTRNALAIIVSDTGIGIPLDRQVNIFELFEQGADETSHRYGGTGLGLALSRRIALEMGCTLSVESMPGAGSTFTLAFTAANAVPASESEVLTSDAA